MRKRNWSIYLALSVFLVTCIMAMAMVTVANAETNVTLAWDANSEDDLAGYKLYAGNRSRNQYGGDSNYSVRLDVGNVTTYTFQGLDDDDWYFAATAYDESGNESAYSNEVHIKLPLPPVDNQPPSAPGNVHITVTVTVNVQ